MKIPLVDFYIHAMEKMPGKILVKSVFPMDRLTDTRTVSHFGIAYFQCTLARQL